MSKDFDDLDWDDGQRAVTADGPVTGEVASTTATARWSLISYRGGLKHGPESHYFSDGTLRYQGEWPHGRDLGTHQAWYASGQLKEERYAEKGRLLRVPRWAEDGTPIGRAHAGPSR